MHFIDNLGFCLSLIGETMQLLGRAEEIGAVPLQSECRTHLDLQENLRILDSPNILYTEVVQRTNMR